MINFGTESFRLPNSAAEREKISDVKASILLPNVLPYMGRLGHRLRYVVSDDLGSNIITKNGVIVFDATLLMETSTQILAAEIAHLWIHWLFDHAKRALFVDRDEGGNFYASVWNVAADCHCLQGIMETQLKRHIPEHLTTFENLGIQHQSHTEVTYALLLKELADRKLKKEGINATLPDDFSFEDFMSGTGDKPSNIDEDLFDDDLRSELEALEKANQEELDAKLQQFLDGADKPFKGNIWDLPEELFNAGIDPFRATHKYCGSGAGHIPLDNEQLLNDLLAEFGDEAISEEDAEVIRTGTASDIQEHFSTKNRGDMPGEFERFTNERLQKPTVPWRQKLKSSVLRPLNRRAGQVDYTYAIRHKRQRPGEIIRPAMMNSEPGRTAVVIDTSGSMSDRDLAIALSELAGILEGYQVVGFAVDAACHEIGDIKNVQQFKLKGGGGTDMSVGIRHVSEQRPMFTSMVVLTDGETPWPSQPYADNLKIQVIAAVITSAEEGSYLFESIPDWIDYVRIPATHVD